MLQSLIALLVPTLAFSVVLERPDHPRSEWTELGRADPTQRITLGFALKNQRLDELHDLLMSVSTPGEENYGNFQNVESMQKMIAPSAESVSAVFNWLRTSFRHDDIVNLTVTSDLLTVRTTIEQAEKFLDCEYYNYVSTVDESTRVTRVRMDTDYHVDSSVVEHLYFVSPTHRFPALKSPKVTSLEDMAPEATEVTPTFLREMYNCQSAYGASANNSQGIAAFQNQKYTTSDVEDLWKKYDVRTTTLTRVPSSQGSGYGVESELDVQYITSLGQGIPTEHWYTSGGFASFPDALFAWSQDVLSAASNGTSPPIFSVSYGTSESYYGIEFVTKFNTQLMLIGSAGVTIFFASGDSGAGGGCGVPPFIPDYPASSPYVTAVGGITGGNPASTPPGESVWVDGGGGFSNYVGRQSWQQTAVVDYFSTASGLPASSSYNASGRGYPDISAQSVYFIVYVRGSPLGVSGTSASSPTSAGIFALLIDLRLSSGMSALGFANPLIYQIAADDSSAFNDCVDGYNKGCGFGSGFYASSGWDPASGWGSPNYAVLSQHVLKTGESTKKFN